MHLSVAHGRQRVRPVFRKRALARHPARHDSGLAGDRSPRVAANLRIRTVCRARGFGRSNRPPTWPGEQQHEHRHQGKSEPSRKRAVPWSRTASRQPTTRASGRRRLPRPSYPYGAQLLWCSAGGEIRKPGGIGKPARAMRANEAPLLPSHGRVAETSPNAKMKGALGCGIVEGFSPAGSGVERGRLALM